MSSMVDAIGGSTVRSQSIACVGQIIFGHSIFEQQPNAWILLEVDHYFQARHQLKLFLCIAFRFDHLEIF